MKNRTSVPTDPEELRQFKEAAMQRYNEKRRASIQSTPQLQAERGGTIMPGFKWARATWAEAVTGWLEEADELGIDIRQQIADATNYLEESNKFVD